MRMTVLAIDEGPCWVFNARRMADGYERHTGLRNTNCLLGYRSVFAHGQVSSTTSGADFSNVGHLSTGFELSALPERSQLSAARFCWSSL